ncbi:MAG TPA: DsbA family protein [Thermoleophilaceae bacterium]|nr:DsbA family protein [Thermoleophilaceae bacterium]
MAERATFYFDFNSPYAWLAAERIDGFVPDAEWRPIAFPLLLHRLGTLEAAMKRNSAPVVEEVSRRAAERGLPPFNPPPGWPLESWSLVPLRAALFADDRGRLRDFSAAVFRAMFARAQPITELTTVLEAAGEAGLDAAGVREAVERQDVKDRLKANTDEAFDRGVTGIPTVAIGDDLFWGDDRLEEAAAALAR